MVAEPAVACRLQNTMVRFARDEIYTFVGSVLLAVNPYKLINGLYGEAPMKSYEPLPSMEMVPHIYAVVERAYRKACHGRGSQSLIISGESGAGKTESTKVAISYLVWRSRSEEASADAGLTMRILQARRKAAPHQQPRPQPQPCAASHLASPARAPAAAPSPLQANPLLEALGNATTTRNTNSSRFGKCVRLEVEPASGALVGGRVITYLLEKSRVTFFGANERNFHAFYQLLSAVARAEGDAGRRVVGGEAAGCRRGVGRGR